MSQKSDKPYNQYKNNKARLESKYKVIFNKTRFY